MVKPEKLSPTFKRRRNLLISSYIKPRRKRRNLSSSTCRAVDGEVVGDIRLDDTYQVITKETLNNPGLQPERGGIKLSIRRSTFQQPVKTEKDNMHEQPQKDEGMKKCHYWNQNSLKAWGTKIKKMQQLSGGGRSRPSTRAQTAAIQRQELNVARMKSDEVDCVPLSVHETSSTVSSGVASRRSSLRSQESSDCLSLVTEQSKSVKHTSKTMVIQRYLQQNITSDGCDKGETRDLGYFHFA
jgi:hypothetical protein